MCDLEDTSDWGLGREGKVTGSSGETNRKAARAKVKPHKPLSCGKGSSPAFPDGLW